MTMMLPIHPRGCPSKFWTTSSSKTAFFWLLSLLFFACRCAVFTSATTTESSSSSSSSSSFTTTPFRILHREHGQISRDIPIFAATSEAASALLDKENNNEYGNDSSGETKTTTSKSSDPQCTASSSETRAPPSIEEYSLGAFVIHNVLTPSECQRFIDISEQMGYTQDAPVSLGRSIRHNDNCVWIMDEDVNRIVFDRVQELLPPIVYEGYNLSTPIGINHRWRFYRYNPQDIFKAHYDGAWTYTGLDSDGVFQDDLLDGTALSWLTFLIYLNDDFEGGSTTLYPIETQFGGGGDPNDDQPVHVPASQGSVLVFYHGEHPLNRLHEGSLVTNGTKYVARTEVMYRMPPALQHLV